MRTRRWKCDLAFSNSLFLFAQALNHHLSMMSRDLTRFIIYDNQGWLFSTTIIPFSQEVGNLIVTVTSKRSRWLQDSLSWCYWVASLHGAGLPDSDLSFVYVVLAVGSGTLKSIGVRFSTWGHRLRKLMFMVDDMYIVVYPYRLKPARVYAYEFSKMWYLHLKLLPVSLHRDWSHAHICLYMS